MGVGEDSPFAVHLARHLGSLNPPQTPINTPLSLVAKMIFQYLTLLDGVPLISMVSTVQVLVPPGRVTPHLVRPPKVWLVLNSIYNPVHQLLERYIYFPHLCFWFLNP